MGWAGQQAVTVFELHLHRRGLEMHANAATFYTARTRLSMDLVQTSSSRSETCVSLPANCAKAIAFKRNLPLYAYMAVMKLRPRVTQQAQRGPVGIWLLLRLR